MEFFDKIGKKASAAYKVTADKTGKIAKEAKIRMKIGESKNNVTDLYEEIGKLVYENYVKEEKTDISNELKEKCEKIKSLNDEIGSMLQECLELKDKKQCSNCSKEIDKETKFCPYCGAKQEDVVETETSNNEESKDESAQSEGSNENSDQNVEKTSTEKTEEEPAKEVEVLDNNNNQ